MKDEPWKEQKYQPYVALVSKMLDCFDPRRRGIFCVPSSLLLQILLPNHKRQRILAGKVKMKRNKDITVRMYALPICNNKGKF